METRNSRRDRAQRGLASVETLRPDDMATMERLSPPKPRRNQDALCQTTLSAPPGARLRPSGRGVPSSCRRPERPHRARYAHYRDRGTSLSGERGTPTVRPFVQQSLCHRSRMCFTGPSPLAAFRIRFGKAGWPPEITVNRRSDFHPKAESSSRIRLRGDAVALTTKPNLRHIFQLSILSTTRSSFRSL